jgi:hypothetical protein
MGESIVDQSLPQHGRYRGAYHRVDLANFSMGKARRYMQAYQTDFNFSGLIGKMQRSSGDAFHDSVIKPKLKIF